MSTALKNKMVTGIMIGLILTGLFLRIKRFDRPIWADEIYQVKHLDYKFYDLLVNKDNFSPEGFNGDLMLLWPLGQFTSNQWILTIPHMIATLIGFFLFLKICKLKIQSPHGRIFALILFVFNRNLVFHALELRAYAVLPTLAMGLFLAGDYIIKNNKWDFKSHSMFLLLAGFTTLFHAYGVVILSCCLLYHAVTSFQEIRTSNVRNLAPLYIIAFLIIFPIWRHYASPTLTTDRIHDAFEYVGIWHKLFAFIFGNIGDLVIRFLWTVPFLLNFSMSFVKSRNLFERNSLTAILVILPTALIFYADYVGNYFFVPRQFVWTMPFWALATGLSTDALLESINSRKIPSTIAA